MCYYSTQIKFVFEFYHPLFRSRKSTILGQFIFGK